MPIVAAYEMLAKKLAFHTGSEVTFNPAFFFYFSVCLLQKKWELNSKRERRGRRRDRLGILSPSSFPHYLIHIFNLGKNRTVRNKNSLFVASEQGLDTSIQANIQTAATKVTDIGWLLSLGAFAFSKKSKYFQKSERFSSLICEYIV